jgi:hypothetical protein
MDTCIITHVQSDTRIKDARPIGRVYFYTCPFGHEYLIRVSNWTRVLNTRVQFDRWIKYTCQFVTTVQLDTCLIGRVSTVTGIVDTRPIVEIFVVTSTVRKHETWRID